MGLVEILLCVTMSSTLLTGVAFAFRASFKDIRQRSEMVESVRSGLHQITTDIGSSTSAAPYDPVAGIATSEISQFNTQVVPGNPMAGLPSVGGTGVQGIQLLKTHADSRDPGASAANPVTINYWLDAPSRTLYMTRKTASATATPYAVCGFVQSMRIYMQPLYLPPDPPTRTNPGVVCRRIVVIVTLANQDVNGQPILADGNHEPALTFTDSAVPRRIFPGM